MNRTTALVLATGAVVGLAGVLVLPRLPGGTAEQLHTIADHGTIFLAGSALTFVSAALLMLGFARLTGEFRAGGARIGATFAMVAALGWFLHTALIAVNAVTYQLAQQPDPAAMAALADSLYAGPVFLTILLPMLVSTVVGMIGATIALWRSGRAPVWVLPLVVLALVSDFVAPEQVSGVPMFALLAIAFGVLALRRTAPAASAGVGTGRGVVPARPVGHDRRDAAHLGSVR